MRRRMHEQRNNETTTEETPPSERRPWSAPQLERLDFDGTEMSAKNPSSFELGTSYNSPAVC
jgi:hypothetical protein